MRPDGVLWPDEAVDAMSRAAREILARVGVKVDSGDAVRALQAAGCAPGPAGRVLVPAAVVERALAAVPPAFTLLARDPAATLPVSPAPTATFVHNSGEDPNVADPVSGVNRPSTMADQRLAGRVMHRLRYPQSVNSLFWPSDVPPDLQPLYSYLALALETDKHLGSPCVDHGWQVAPLVAMAEAVVAAGRAATDGGAAATGAVARPDAEAGGASHASPAAEATAGPAVALDVSFSPVSPLHLPADVCDGLAAAAARSAAVMVLPCPMGGTTAPASLAGGLAQQHAEVLAGVVLVQTLRPGTPCVAGVRLGPAHPRTGGELGGAPEGSLVSLGATQLARRDGLACDCYGPTTGSPVLELQAGLDSALTLALSALARPRFLSGCGSMQGTATCLEALVVHDQLFAALFNGLTARACDDEALAVDVVADAVLTGRGFLGSHHTRRYLRHDVEQPRLGFRGGIDEWLASGRTSLVDEARERVAELVAAAPLGLPDDVGAELCRVIDDAARARGFSSWPDPWRLLVEPTSA
jgi:trimethylamine--corrinoid protein Co-methyltransferase